jgi:hypothetical protein
LSGSGRDRIARVPFKSQAQRRKFAQLLVDGKISAETFEEWNRETGARKLPEHATRKTARSKNAGRRKSVAQSRKTKRPRRK